MGSTKPNPFKKLLIFHWTQSHPHGIFESWRKGGLSLRRKHRQAEKVRTIWDSCIRPAPMASTWRVKTAALSIGMVVLFGWLTAFVEAYPLKSSQSVAATNAPVFEKDILPIFQTNCLRCHDSKAKSSGLDLSSVKGVLTGSSSGPVVVPKDPDASRLYGVVHDGKMPLDRKTRVSRTEMETIRLWIEALSKEYHPARGATESVRHHPDHVASLHALPWIVPPGCRLGPEDQNLDD